MGMKGYIYTDENGKRWWVHNKSPIKLRFWSRVNKDGPAHPELKTKCWLWTGSRRVGRYGAFTSTEYPKECSAHRFSWIFTNGNIPDGSSVLHRCDNTACVNPDHLFLGSDDDNMQDKVAKGRQSKRESHGMVKLTEEQVEEIRKRYRFGSRTKGRRSSDLAREFNVHQATILSIVSNLTWRNDG